MEEGRRVHRGKGGEVQAYDEDVRRCVDGRGGATPVDRGEEVRLPMERRSMWPITALIHHG